MNTVTAFANGSFEPEVFGSSEYGMNAFQMQYIYKRYKDAPMHPHVLKYWESKGVKKSVYDLGDDGRAYYVLSPGRLEEGRKYPVIYCFHDRPDDAFLAETYGYTELIEHEKLICVYPEYRLQGLSGVDVDLARILKELPERGYPVDEERIYVSGFSYGASAAAKLTMKCSQRLAGTAMVCGSHIFRGEILAKRLKMYSRILGVKEPLICVGGNRDGRNSWPLEKEAWTSIMKDWMTEVAKIEDFIPLNPGEARLLCKNSPDRVKREFGLDFHRTWVDYMEGTYWYCGQFEDAKDIPMARFISVEGLPHIHCRNIAVQIWSYLRQFRRDRETKDLIYTPGEDTEQPY
ncbi:alpha/beta hydrolase [Blautia schinkii]|nr:alpha/beta hydrolase [Blautia schinkii]